MDALSGIIGSLYAVSGVIGSIIAVVALQLWRFRQRRKDFRLLARVLPIQSSFLQLASYFLYPGHAHKTTRLAIRPSITRKYEGDIRGDKRTLRAYLHSAEAEQLIQLMKSIAPLPIEFALITGEAIPAGEKNLIIVGGDYHNAAAKSLIEKLSDLEIRFLPPKLGQAHERLYYRGIEFGCTLNKVNASEGQIDVVKKDVGLIYRCRSSTGMEILMCVGIHMHGSAAALAVALSPGFQSEIAKQQLKEFVQLVEVGVLSDGLSVDWGSIRWKKKFLIDAKNTLMPP